MQLSNPPPPIDPFKIIPLRDVSFIDVNPRIVPDTDSLRLELTDYTGPFKNVTYDPSPVLKANSRTKATLSGNGLPTITIDFEYYVKGHTTQLKAWCWYVPERGGRRIRVSMENAQRFVRFLFDLEKQKRAILLQNSDKKKQAEKVTQINEEQEQLKKLGKIFEALSQVSKPFEIPEDFEGLGTFRFHEYVKVGNDKIELLKTK